MSRNKLENSRFYKNPKNGTKDTVIKSSLRICQFQNSKI